MSRVHRFAALEPAERRLMLRAWATVALLRAATLLVSYGRVRGIVARLGRSGRGAGAGTRPAPEQIARAVMRAGALVPGGRNCLVRALAAEALLARFGYPVALRFGIARTASGALIGHAWLESDGHVLVGDFEPDRYAELRADARCPADGAR
jgi:Transglutaminase-like superfamily